MNSVSRFSIVVTVLAGLAAPVSLNAAAAKPLSKRDASTFTSEADPKVVE
jgi:hypothetical protein